MTNADFFRRYHFRNQPGPIARCACFGELPCIHSAETSSEWSAVRCFCRHPAVQRGGVQGKADRFWIDFPDRAICDAYHALLPEGMAPMEPRAAIAALRRKFAEGAK